MDNGQWIMDNGQWIMDSGQWIMDSDYCFDLDVFIEAVKILINSVHSKR